MPTAKRETNVEATRLNARDSLPTPISIPASQGWDGNDGKWSTFTIGVGTPPQYSRVLISTTSVQPWVVLSQGCTSEDPDSCTDDRGGIFRPSDSTTWVDKGFYTLLVEQNLGIDENGDFGLDSVVLGVPGSAASAYSTTGQMVAGIAAKQFYIANWGIRPAATNLTDLNNHFPSLLTNLKNENKLPSLSWGYTAGAYSQFTGNKQGLASLTFGGYDASKFNDHNTTFQFSADSSRDLVVAIRSITANSSTSLLDAPLNAFIDASVSHIWLDEASCKLFEDAFNLEYNSAHNIYLVNDTVHDDLMSSNPELTFSLTNTLDDSSTPLNITLPYSAFDLELTPDYPGVSNTTKYFPLRRGDNATQYTLGRTFLQHAYLIADYERHTFSVHQTLFSDSDDTDLQTIEPVSRPSNGTASNGTNTSEKSHTSGLPAGAIGGIAVGAIVAFTALVLFLLWYRRRQKRKNERIAGPSERPSQYADNEIDSKEKPLHPELHGVASPGAEMPSPAPVWKPDPMHEISGDEARRSELGLGNEHERRELAGTRVEQELEGERSPPPVYELAAREIERRR